MEDNILIHPSNVIPSYAALQKSHAELLKTCKFLVSIMDYKTWPNTEDRCLKVILAAEQLEVKP